MRRLLYGIGVLLVVMWVAPLAAQAPTGAIRGRVTDQASQRPLQGVTLSIGTRGVVSTNDGRFQIVGLAAGTDTLHARLIGYAPFDQAVEVIAGQTVTVDITMVAQAVNLSEMVVVGYGELRAADITGAVSNVTADEFNPGRIVTPTELIQNKVAGVQVVENNEPGGGTTIRIRGATSVNASSDPLFVVDGVPLGTGSGTGASGGRDPLNFLNPSDIESITVLRDASAASIYGVNAANGVVLITTKTAKRDQQAKIEYSGTASVSGVTRLPSMLNASQFRTAVTRFASQNVPQLGNANTDWFGQVDRTAYGQEQNVALSGSSGTMNYRLSGSYLVQNGIIQKTRTQRVTLGFNMNQRLFSDRLNIKLNVRGSRAADDFTPGGVIGNAAQMGPTQPVYDSTSATGFYNWSTGLTSADNPVEILKLAIDRSTTYRSVGGVSADYSLPWVDGLKATVNLGFDAVKASRQTFNPRALKRQTVTDHGNINLNDPTQLNTVFDAFLNYAVPKEIGPGILDVTGGYSYSESKARYPNVFGKNLTTDALGTDGVPALDAPQARVDVQNSRLISFFGRVNYNVKDRYLAAASVRYDGSSRFGEHPWGTFPSFSVAWRASEEPFLKHIGALSDLKLRGSWARTGNQSIANYLQYSTYTPSDAQTTYQFGDTVFSTARPGAVDRFIKWETTRSVNFGLDYGFDNNRFSGAIDYYHKRTKDMVFYVPVPAGTNLSNFVTTNIGSMLNQGVELSLSAKILQGDKNKLTWTADFTASHNKNELTAINPTGGSQTILTGLVAGGVGTFIQVLTPGQPIYSFYVFQHKLDANGKPIYTDTNGDGTINDQDLYVDRNGDGLINQNDLRAFHDPAPKWIFGHTSSLGYKNFDLGFTLRAYTGNYVYNNVASNLGTYSEVGRSSPYNLHTSVLKTGFLTPQYQSDYYVEKASFLRMDNITLGYSFNLRGQSARVFGTLQNAFTITGYSGVDPTAGLNGIDNNLYPRSRTFTTGLNLQF